MILQVFIIFRKLPMATEIITVCNKVLDKIYYVLTDKFFNV